MKVAHYVLMENHPLSSSKPSLGQAPVCYPGRQRQRTGLGAAEGHAPALSLPGSGQGAVSRYRGGVFISVFMAQVFSFVLLHTHCLGRAPAPRQVRSGGAPGDKNKQGQTRKTNSIPTRGFIRSVRWPPVMIADI